MHVPVHSTHACMYHSCACLTSMLGLRVACYGVLKLGPGGLALVAPDCRSWGSPARGTSWRTSINPNGIGRQFVMNGNLMASRTLRYITYMHAFTCAMYMHAFMHSYIITHDAAKDSPSLFTLPGQSCNLCG